MKKMTKFLVVLIAIMGLVGIAGCDEPKPVDPVEPYNALGNFADGGDGLYVLNTNTTSELTFSYNKENAEGKDYSYSYLYTDVDANVSLENYKKLVFTTVGNGTMLIKLECSDGTAAKEVGINVNSINSSYEWNLMTEAEFLKSVTKITIIAAPGKNEGVGEITITKLSFEVEVADNYIISTGFSNIPTNVNEYNGTDENFDFNAKWENTNDETYVIEQDEETKIVSVEYTKTAGMEYSCMQSNVKGDFTKFKYVVLVAKGEENKTIAIKAANGVEKTFKFDGTKQTFVLDISTMTTEAKNAISEIILFASIGAIQNGSFEIHEAYMTETAPIEIEEIIINEYNGTDEEFDISNHWYDGGDSVYTTTTVADGVQVSYDKSSTQTYSSLKAFVSGTLSNFKYISVELTGEANKSVMLKAETNGEQVEKSFTLTGERQVIYIDISTISAAARDAMQYVIIFAAPGSGGSGTFTIHNAVYTNELKGVVIPTTNVYEQYAEVFDINHYWIDNNTGAYTIITEGTKTIVNYNKTTNMEWSTIKTTIEGLGDEFTYLKLIVKGEAGKTLLVKPNDLPAFEHTITLTGDEQTEYIRIPSEFNALFIFAEPNTIDVTGSFEIIEAKLVRDLIIDEEETLSIMDSLFKNADPVYTLNSQNGQLTVEYDKANYPWALLNAIISGNNSGFKKLTVNVTGPKDVQILIKFNNDDATEAFVTFTGEAQEIIIDDKVPSVISSMQIFIAPGVENTTGTVIFNKIELTKIEEEQPKTVVEGEYTSNKEEAYTIESTEIVTTITYNRTEAQWTCVFFTPTVSVEKVGKLYLDVQSSKAIEIYIKPNDDSSLEYHASALTTDRQIIEIDVNKTLEKIVFIIDPEINSEGVFSIYSISYTESSTPTENIYTGGETFDINHFWKDGGNSVYTVTETANGMAINYNKVGGASYATLLTSISNLANEFNYLVITITGEDNTTLLLKPNDNGSYEKTIILSSTATTYYVPIPAEMTKMIIFALPGVETGSGEFTINSAVLMNLADGEGEFSGSLNAGPDAGVYTIEKKDKGITVNYNKGNFPWSSLSVALAGIDLNDKTLAITLTGSAGLEILVKLNNNNNYETKLTLTGGTDIFTITNAPNILTSINIFIAPGVENVTGSVDLSMELASEVEEIVPVGLNGTYTDGPDGVYDITVTTEKVTIVYDKKTFEWPSFTFTLKTALTDCGSMTFKVKGVAGVPVLFKDGNNTYETRFTLTGEEDIVVVKTPLVVNSILIFVAGGTTELQGTLEILDSSYEVAEDTSLTYAFQDGGDSIYTISGIVGDATSPLTVSYAKNGPEYGFMSSILSVPTNCTTLKITITADKDVELIMKPNDGYETRVSLTTTSQEITISFDGTIALNKIIFMIAPGVATEVSGTFVISSIVLE